MQKQFMLKNNNSQNDFYFPAEFDKHEAIWLSIKNESYWSGKSRISVVLDIIKALQPFVKVKALVGNTDELNKFKKLVQTNHIDDSHVTYMMMKNADAAHPWLRDHGPVFLRNIKGKLAIAAFGYDFYGESAIVPNPEFIKNIEGINIYIADMMKIPIVKSDIISEGGNREFNGHGTMMALEVTELARNPGKTRDAIERELLSVLGQKKMIWLKKSIVEDEKTTHGPIINNIYSSTITGGHIDEVARFVDPYTVLLAQVTPEERDTDPIMKISYERMEVNYQILSNATDQGGQPFKIIRLPVANPMVAQYIPVNENDYALLYFKGAKVGKPIQYHLATSYLNFLVTNGVVLCPKYWHEGGNEATKCKDQQASFILQKAFPDRAIVQIDPEAFNHGGGGIHCSTQQQPAIVG